MHIPSLNNMHIHREARAARPTGDINKAPYSDNVTFGKYEAIVIKCTKIAKLSSSLNVLAEFHSMISKNKMLAGSKAKVRC